MAKRIKELPLFFFKMIDTDRNDSALICSSWLISCYKNHPFIQLVCDLMLEYWRTENKMIDYFVFHLFVHMVKDKMPDIWDSIPTYNNISPHILQFEMNEQYDYQRYKEITTMSDFHKLYRVPLDEVVEGSYYQKILNGDI